MAKARAQTDIVSVRLDAGVMARLDTFCAQHGVGRSEALRQLLSRALAAPEREIALSQFSFDTKRRLMRAVNRVADQFHEIAERELRKADK